MRRCDSPLLFTNPKTLNYSYFEPSGNLQSVTSPLPGTVNGTQSVTTSYTYSALGNLLTVTSPGNGTVASMTTTYGYTADGTYSQNEALGQPLTLTDNLNKTTHVRYDTQGRTTSVTDALGNTANRTYNIIGQTYQSLAPATGQTGSGRTTTQNTYLYPGGPLTQSILYNESGVQVLQVTPVYGKEGEQLSATGDLNPVTTAYDALYRPKTLTDGSSHATTSTYAPAGYAQQSQLANGDVYKTTTWDANGNILTTIDGRGTTVNYVYNDVESRLTDIQYPANPALNVHIDYDNYGRAYHITDNAGSKLANFDDLNLPTSVSTTYLNAARTGNLPVLNLIYAYNPNGSRNTLTTPAGSFHYGYDGRGLPNSLSNPNSETFAWTYLDNGWLWTQSAGSLATSTYTYNALGQVTDLAHRKANNTLLADFGSMSQDAVGNRLSMTANLPAAPASYSGTTTYGYDNRNELTQETSQRAGGYSNGYGYDLVGNPTTWKGATQTFNLANQNTQGGTLTFDGNGNPAGWQGTALTWDANNKLTAVGNVLTAGYGANGLRAWKQTSAGRTYFLYDGIVPVCETDASGNVTAVNTWGVNGLLARRAAGSSVFYCFDPQGSVSVRLDGGNILSSHCNEAWGTQVSTGTGYASDPYAGYGGQWGYYKDAETGLHLLGHRYYDSSTGRFLNRDPEGYGGGINLYAYCGGNPLLSADPLGTSFISIGIGVVVGIGVGIGTANPIAGIIAGLGTAAAISHWGEGNSWSDSGADGAAAGMVTCEVFSQNWPAVLPTLGGRAAVPPIDESPLPPMTTGGSGGGGVEPHSWHYSQSPPESFEGGLLPGSSTTPDGGLSAGQAGRGLGIPRPIYAYPVYPQPGTPVQGPTPIQSSGPYPWAGFNGEEQFYWPIGTGPGTIGSPRKL